MKERRDIVAALARERTVEAICSRIAGADPLPPELQDLCQNVYVTLLTYDEDKIIDLAQTDAIRFFIARILINQYRSKSSPFYKTFRQYYRRNVLEGVFNDRDLRGDWED